MYRIDVAHEPLRAAIKKEEQYNLKSGEARTELAPPDIFSRHRIDF